MRLHSWRSTRWKLTTYIWISTPVISVSSSSRHRPDNEARERCRNGIIIAQLSASFTGLSLTARSRSLRFIVPLRPISAHMICLLMGNNEKTIIVISSNNNLFNFAVKHSSNSRRSVKYSRKTISKFERMMLLQLPPKSVFHANIYLQIHSPDVANYVIYQNAGAFRLQTIVIRTWCELFVFLWRLRICTSKSMHNNRPTVGANDYMTVGPMPLKSK